MIQSMTAFARTQNESPWGTIICEIRSINHRYLELSLRQPEIFNTFEPQIRDKIREKIQRGKIECFIRFQNREAATDITLNAALLQKLFEANAIIASKHINPAPLNTLEILRWPGIMQAPELDVDVIKVSVLDTLQETIDHLLAARQREGEQLRLIFIERLQNMMSEIKRVRIRLPEILQLQREKLLNRFADAKIQLDSTRLEQELVMVAQKIDVTEEIERLQTHILEVNRVLKIGGNMGRRLDFLMQELNREANTLGSKSVDTETTQVAIELKVLIEQMREQVQNIE